jgi:hypothetical protein
LRVHHDRDGKAVPDPVASAAEADGANGSRSAGELIGSAHPSPNAPAARE